MNKLVKGLAIATVTLLGANYVLKKVNKLKTKKVTTEEDYGIVNGERYVILSDVYNNVANGKIDTMLEKTTDKITNFSTLTDRKYHTLNFQTQREQIENEEQETKGRAL